MFDSIKITPSKELKKKMLLESFSLLEDKDDEKFEESTELFQEATFRGGKESLRKIIDAFQAIKDSLDSELKNKGNRFDPHAFWKSPPLLQLERAVIDTFGVRDAEIHSLRERFSRAEDDFETKILNCYTYIPEARFPIEALVTDKGFYDSSHILRMLLLFTLGIIRVCSAEELTAVLVHELGHNIDPALVDIQYTKTNIYSKYLTDREGAINQSEKKVMEKEGSSPGLIMLIIYGIAGIVNWIRDRAFNAEKALQKIQVMIQNDKDKFTRQHNIEAFADNFARMYGLGPALFSAFRNLNEYYDGHMSRIKKEKRRQRIIAQMTRGAIKDVHKTDIHRIYNLIKEYKADIDNPDVPKVIKKQLQEDLTELETVLDWYLNKRSEFENRINRLIYEELQKADGIEPTKQEELVDEVQPTESQIGKGATPTDEPKEVAAENENFQ